MPSCLTFLADALEFGQAKKKKEKIFPKINEYIRNHVMKCRHYV